MPTGADSWHWGGGTQVHILPPIYLDKPSFVPLSSPNGPKKASCCLERGCL